MNQFQEISSSSNQSNRGRFISAIFIGLALLSVSLLVGFNFNSKNVVFSAEQPIIVDTPHHVFWKLGDAASNGGKSKLFPPEACYRNSRDITRYQSCNENEVKYRRLLFDWRCKTECLTLHGYVWQGKQIRIFFFFIFT